MAVIKTAPLQGVPEKIVIGSILFRHSFGTLYTTLCGEKRFYRNTLANAIFTWKKEVGVKTCVAMVSVVSVILQICIFLYCTGLIAIFVIYIKCRHSCVFRSESTPFCQLRRISLQFFRVCHVIWLHCSGSFWFFGMQKWLSRAHSWLLRIRML